MLNNKNGYCITIIIASFSIFTLFFASICHAAGHAKVTDFNKYKEWMRGKNKKRAYETFEFIEDIRVNDFLKNNFPEYYSEIIKVEEFFNIINDKLELEDFKKYSKKKLIVDMFFWKEAIRVLLIKYDIIDRFNQEVKKQKEK